MNIVFRLIGISSNPIKSGELEKIADIVYLDINQVDWEII